MLISSFAKTALPSIYCDQSYNYHSIYLGLARFNVQRDVFLERLVVYRDGFFLSFFIKLSGTQLLWMTVILQYLLTLLRTVLSVLLSVAVLKRTVSARVVLDRSLLIFSNNSCILLLLLQFM